MYMNEEKLQFKDLPREVQHEYLDLALDCKLEYLLGDIYVKKIAGNSIGFDTTYRPTLEKPSLDWSAINEKWKYCARDFDGELWLYTALPTAKSFNWVCENWRDKAVCINSLLKSYKLGTVDWKDSLIERGE